MINNDMQHAIQVILYCPRRIQGAQDQEGHPLPLSSEGPSEILVVKNVVDKR